MAALDNSKPGTSTGIKRKCGDDNNLHSMIQSILTDSNNSDNNDNDNANNDNNDNDNNDNDSDDDNGSDYILHQEEPNDLWPRALSRNGRLGRSLTPSLTPR